MEKLKMKSELPDIECRACSRRTEVSITDKELQKISKIYTELTSLKVHSEDAIPLTFCDLCQGRLLEFETFKRQCEQTYQLLCIQRKELKPYQSPAVEVCTRVSPAFEVCLVKLEVDEIDLVKVNKNYESPPSKPETLFICDKCNKKFSSRKTLKTHLLGHLSVNEKKKILKCPREGCDKKFSREDRLSAHLRVHDGRKPEVCPICEMELSTQRSLRHHIETHNTERNYKCSYCEKTFKSKKNVTVHERYIHKKERTFVCNQCGAVFYNPSVLSTHIKSKHSDEKKFQCDECPRVFKHSCHLKDHKIRHKGTRENVCTKCGKTFVTSFDLKRHDRENHSSTVRTVRCEICSKILKDKKSLKQHMFIHTGEKPFKCSLCPNGFTVKKALERHMTTHTGIRPFKCILCEKSYSERFYLNKHIERNHGGNPEALKTDVEDKRYLPKN